MGKRSSIDSGNGAPRKALDKARAKIGAGPLALVVEWLEHSQDSTATMLRERGDPITPIRSGGNPSNVERYLLVAEEWRDKGKPRGRVSQPQAGGFRSILDTAREMLDKEGSCLIEAI